MELRRWTPALFALLAFAPTVARAADDAKLACVRSAEKTQSLRADGRWLEAREEATRCAADECPKLVRSDCRGWRASLDEVIPTVIVHVHDSKGAVVPELHVVAANRDVPSNPVDLAASPIPLDPGTHAFTFEARGFVTKSVSIAAEPGAHDHVVDVTMDHEAVKMIAKAPEPILVERPRTPLAFRLALLGLGIGGVTTFAAVGLPAWMDVQHMRDTCAPLCASNDVSSAKTRIVVGDIGLGVGLVSIAAAAWLTWLSPKMEVPLVVAPSSRGVTVGFAGALP